MGDKARLATLLAEGAIDRQKACKRKRAYLSLSDARNAAKVASQRIDRIVETYRCPFNRDHWHITKHKHGEDE